MDTSDPPVSVTDPAFAMGNAVEQPVSSCPPGLEHLSSTSRVTISSLPSRPTPWMKYAGYKYNVFSESGGRIFQAVEGDKSEDRSFKTTCRYSFCMVLLRYDGTPVLEMWSAKIHCNAGNILVAYAGNPIGIARISRKCCCCATLRYHVVNGREERILDLVADSSTCRMGCTLSGADFTVISPDGRTEVGNIMLKGKSSVVVTFHPNMDVSTKAVLVGCAIMQHIQVQYMRAHARVRY